jgi:hypothetical protein
MDLSCKTDYEMTTALLKMYAADPSERLVTTYEITGFHNPKYCNLVRHYFMIALLLQTNEASARVSFAYVLL